MRLSRISLNEAYSDIQNNVKQVNNKIMQNNIKTAIKIVLLGVLGGFLGLSAYSYLTGSIALRVAVTVLCGFPTAILVAENVDKNVMKTFFTSKATLAKVKKKYNHLMSKAIFENEIENDILPPPTLSQNTVKIVNLARAKENYKNEKAKYWFGGLRFA